MNIAQKGTTRVSRYKMDQILGVSWCCGNYCWLAFVLWCGYCSVSFQSFELRHWCPQHQETTQILMSDAISSSIMRMKNHTGLSLGEVVYPFISFLDLIISKKMLISEL